MRTRFDWSDAAVDRVCAMLAQDHTYEAVARELGVSRSAIAGLTMRLRAAGDKRLPAARRDTITTKQLLARQVDRLADLMAEGCPNLVAAAHRMRLPVARVEALWRGIRAKLGWQAQ